MIGPDPRALRARPLPTSTLGRFAEAFLLPEDSPRWRRLSPGQKAAEVVVGGLVRVPVLVAVVGLSFAGELLDRAPDPRVLFWAARNVRVRRIR